eukprot:7381479-Pyramimonas_sp.AAC.1
MQGRGGGGDKSRGRGKGQGTPPIRPLLQQALEATNDKQLQQALQTQIQRMGDTPTAATDTNLVDCLKRAD